MPLVTINQSVREKLKDHKIIPEVVDDFTPTALLSVEYPKGNIEVSLGNTISPGDTQELPTIRITPDGDDNASYTVVLTDPDAPSRKDPKWSEFCHWIVTGLRAPSPEELSAARTAEESSIDVSKGTQIVDYMGPAPPPKTGKHRYVFLLYKGGNGDHIEGPSDRKRWGNDESREGARKWAKKYDLELVADTCAGANFFFAQNKSQ
ncbi:PEBP-like protein [Wilcoxina mikolae CBS 423.85]|nr:PEBP-like protein [Wilcoxina mikolae CBS 423.85]